MTEQNDYLVPNQNSSQRIILQTAPRRGSQANISAAKLVYNTSYGGKMVFELTKEQTTLGRREDNNICLSDGKISKYHAVVKRQQNGRYTITDKNSSNGIRVNDRLIEQGVPLMLEDQDIILIGNISLIFYDSQGSVMSSNEMTREEKFLSLVVILPSEKKYEETVTIRAEVEAIEESDFMKADQIGDIQILREDYERLRLAYELSKISVTVDINKLLAKSLDLMFDILPVDRGVVLLVDTTTGFLSTHYVKLSEAQAAAAKEILLSSTILHKVFYSRKCLITSDAMDDPMLGQAASVRHGQIRSVICVPLIAHNKVYGILHLDSKDRINSFSKKDLALVKAISSQTAMVIENMNLIKEVEAKAKITEQLSRFLPPHVVDRMTTRSDMIRTGGREMVGTIIFADIRGFTQLSEKSNPMEVVNLLNDYFERIVFKYDGIVDKYIGDALMAVFGTMEEEPDAEFRAVAAGLEFQNAIVQMNQERQQQRKAPISIGVGELLAGFIGSAQRLEYTCIGDTVNTASRICSVAEEHTVLIGESTYSKIHDRIQCEELGTERLKGKDKGVKVKGKNSYVGRYADNTIPRSGTATMKFSPSNFD